MMRILVIGATSYVGSHVVEECLRRGWEVFPLARNRVSQRILDPGRGSLDTGIPPGELRRLGRVDAVLNFAYPKNLGFTRVHQATLRLMNTVADAGRLLAPRVVIHVSTQSVYGYTIRREPRPALVWWASGESYVETKALAEWLFLLRDRRALHAKVVLRLGNVIGPGAYWTSELSRKLVFGEPIGRGASNATYVANIADYVCYIVSTDPQALQAFGPFHHLAEFSPSTWEAIVDRLAAAIGTRPRYSDAPPPPPKAGLREFLKTGIRFSAIFLPEAVLDHVDRMQEQRHAWRFPPAPVMEAAADDHPTLHQTGVFPSRTLPGWTPKVDLTRAMEETAAWLVSSGYSLSR